MKLSITGSDTYTLTAQTIDKLIRTGDGDAALLYLYMLRTQGQSTDTDASKALGMGQGAINTATVLLSKMGLIDFETDETNPVSGDIMTAATKTVSEPRAYTEEEVVAEIVSGSDFAVLVDETTRRLGKPLSSPDMLRLYSIYDSLRLPPEVIMQLITHCINECRRTGDGRMPSVAYIEKAAYTWEREGIFSIEQAEEYLKALEAQRSARGQIKQILQISNREFSATERRYVDNWIKMGFEPEIIAHAYDKTVVNTGGLAYPYMDKILQKWNDKGCRTVWDVQNKDTKPAAPSYHARGGRVQGNKHGQPNSEQMEYIKQVLNKVMEE